MDGSERLEHWARGKGLAVLCVLGGVLALAILPGWSEETAPVAGLDSVVVVPFVLHSRVDETLTSAFVDRLSSRDTGWRMIEGSAVEERLPKGKRFASKGEIEPLLKAAKAAGAEAVILGRAMSYKKLDAPGIKLQVKLVEVDSGDVLHQELTKANAWTSNRAKREAAKTAAKRLIKDLAGE